MSLKGRQALVLVLALALGLLGALALWLLLAPRSGESARPDVPASAGPLHGAAHPLPTPPAAEPTPAPPAEVASGVANGHRPPRPGDLHLALQHRDPALALHVAHHMDRCRQYPQMLEAFHSRKASLPPTAATAIQNLEEMVRECQVYSEADRAFLPQLARIALHGKAPGAALTFYGVAKASATSEDLGLAREELWSQFLACDRRVPDVMLNWPSLGLDPAQQHAALLVSDHLRPLEPSGDAGIDAAIARGRAVRLQRMSEAEVQEGKALAGAILARCKEAP